MDIKITLDISDRFDSALARLVSAIQAVTVQTAPAPVSCPIVGEIHIPVDAPNSPVATPQFVEVSKHAEAPKSEPEAKMESPAAANDNAPAETPKPKRGLRAKAEPTETELIREEPAPAPAPEPEPEPEIAPEMPAEPESAEPESAEFPELDFQPVEPEMTLDEVRAVCVQAAKSGKTKVVTDFLAKHSAQSLSKLDSKHYAELAKLVRAAL